MLTYTQHTDAVPDRDTRSRPSRWWWLAAVAFVILFVVAVTVRPWTTGSDGWPPRPETTVEAP